MEMAEIAAYISKKMLESDDVEVSIDQGYSEYEGPAGFVNRELDGRMTITIKINGGA